MTDSTDNARGPERLQDRVAPWMDACFGPEISGDKLERGDRFLEEALELLQSGGYPPERVAALTDYVFNRDVGEPSQEVGGVMITLAAYCLAHGLDMHEAGETELARIWTKVDKIRAKQAAKPKGSALPIPDARIRSALEPDPQDARTARMIDALRYYADPKTYAPDKRYANEPWPIFDDEGALARAALAAFDKGGKTDGHS